VNIIGISAFFHESACCLIQDGRLIAAAEEERFSRIKHDPGFPIAAFEYCLQAGGIGVDEVDCVAWYELPARKLARQLWSGNTARQDLPWLDSLRPQREIREVLGYEGPIEYFEHHLAHAASVFLLSGFERAAVLTVDGVGEWATTTYGEGRGSNLRLFEEVSFPHSLGLFYSTITAYLGFRVNSGEYKVMGLAPYGEPRFLDAMRKLVIDRDGGQYELDLRYFDFVRGQRMYSDALSELLGEAPRQPESEITQFHKDVARSAQALLEEMLVAKAQYLRTRVDAEDLCMAGGVALNCVANGRILREGIFRRLFVQPAAGDAGGCVGAAALAWIRRTGQSPAPLRHACLGPSSDPDQVAELIHSAALPAEDYRGRTPALLEAVVDRLVSGKVVGWCHGRMEFGPRALGARSILADPRDRGMRDRLNRLVKKREAFRPFAPSVLAAHATQHFELDHPSPFMLETCRVRSAIDMPAITHVDQSARPQTVDARDSPRYAALLEAFHRRTGCPVLVNTSFNVRDEPMVASPLDALRCFLGSGLDALVLEDFLLDREGISGAAAQWIGLSTPPARASGVSAVVYTFL